MLSCFLSWWKYLENFQKLFRQKTINHMDRVLRASTLHMCGLVVWFSKPWTNYTMDLQCVVHGVYVCQDKNFAISLSYNSSCSGNSIDVTVIVVLPSFFQKSIAVAKKWRKKHAFDSDKVKDAETTWKKGVFRWSFKANLTDDHKHMLHYLWCDFSFLKFICKRSQQINWNNRSDQVRP